MQEKHTKEPWLISEYDRNGEPILTNDEGFDVAYAAAYSDMPSTENARRIVACVNACAGIDTDCLAGMGTGTFLRQRDRAYEERLLRDEMLEMLEQARAALPDAWLAVKCGVPRDLIDRLNQVIEKAKGPATGI